MPVTAEDIAAYLDTQDDFDLELFVHRSLALSGFRSEHAGTYSDPVTGRPRRFDVRARRFLPGGRQIMLAVECRSLSANSPLLVSRVPRSAQESYHEVVRSWQAQETGEALVEVLRWQQGPELYPENVQVGRKISQIRAESHAIDAEAGEPYGKWSQAIASAADLVHEADRACRDRGASDSYTLVLPVLVVSEETLWAVDYTETGQRARSALLVEGAEVYLGRAYELRPGYSYRISHLHVFTRRGFTRFLAQLATPRSVLIEQMFQFTTRREKARPGDRTNATRSRRKMRTVEGVEGNPRADLAAVASKAPSA